MRIAVMGAGAVGCYIGGRLARAGEEVIFVARGERLRALNEKGLTVIEAGAGETIYPVVAVDDAAEIEPVDIILLCVKLYDTERALRDCEPLLGPSTFVVVLQNGVESAAAAERALGSERVVAGSVYLVVSMPRPGFVERTGDWARLEIAERDTAAGANSTLFAAACRRAGIDCVICDDVERMLWGKFVLLAATSAMTAVTRRPIGYVREDPVALEVARECMHEAVAIARARGVNLPPSIEANALRQLCEEMDPSAKASQLVDLENGRPLELEYLSGAIHRFGKSLGIPTPVHSTVYAALRPFAHGAESTG
jgi:2-dehydropantoate 2-reductase